MSNAVYPIKGPNPEGQIIAGYAVGGTTSITNVAGTGYAISYTSTGLYKVTVATALLPGTFVGVDAGLSATTPAALSAYVVVPGLWSASLGTISFSVYSTSGGSLADLAAAQWLHFRLYFAAIKSTAVI